MDTQELNVSPQQSSNGSAGNPPEDPSLEERWKALPEDVQKKILDKHRDWNVEYEWWDCVFGMFVEDMKEKGVEVDASEIHFSGFWCQGDGAAFAGSITDFQKFIDTNDLKKYQPLADFLKTDTSREFWFKSETRGYRDNCMRFDYVFDTYNVEEEEEPLLRQAQEQLHKDMEVMANEFFEDAEKIFEAAASKLYNDLEEEYEYLTSDEVVLESLLSNEDILKKEIQEYEDEHAEEGEEELSLLAHDTASCDAPQPSPMGEVNSISGRQLVAC